MVKELLIVHSDENVSYFIKKILHNPNYRVTTKTSYDEVKHILKLQTFDLILTDASIRGNFVFKYLEDLKSKTKNTPIIVMSETDQKSITNIVEKIGINEFVSFPFNPLKVKSLINSYI